MRQEKIEIENVSDLKFNALNLDNDLFLLDNPYYKEGYDFPYSLNMTACIIITGGHMECLVDMKLHNISTTGILLTLSDQIVENLSFSSDFKGHIILMSKKFCNELFPPGAQFELFKDVQENGFFPMLKQEIDSVVLYYDMIKGLLQTDNPYKRETAKHLTIAYCYGLGTYIHRTEQKKSCNRFEEITKDFIELVRINCKGHRDIGFYADKLKISTKHLSRAVSNTTGESPIRWLEKYTILNAKNLLKTTTWSVGEISDELSFGNQSDFGKYFKKFTGKSPVEFRKQ